MSSFSIFLQRDKAEGDDVITISRAEGKTRFCVSYMDESTMRAPRDMYLAENEVMEYVGMLVNGLSLDTDPFAHFQMTPPAAPSIQFNIADLAKSSVQQTIYSSLQFAMRHWIVETAPVARRRPTMNPEDAPARRRPTMNPEDTEEDEPRTRRSSSSYRAHTYY